MSHKRPFKLPPYKVPLPQPATLDPIAKWWIGDLVAASRANQVPRYNAQLPLFWDYDLAVYYQFPGQVPFGRPQGNYPWWFAPLNYGDPHTPLGKPRAWWNYFGSSDLTDATFNVHRLMVKGRILYGLDRSYTTWVSPHGPHTTVGSASGASPLSLCGWFPSKAVQTVTDPAPGGVSWADPGILPAGAPWTLGNPAPILPGPITTSTVVPLDTSKWTGGELIAYLGLGGYSWPTRQSTPPYNPSGNAVLGNLLAQDIASFQLAYTNFARVLACVYWGFPFDTSAAIQATLATALPTATYNVIFRQNAGPAPFPAYTAYDTDVSGDLQAFYNLTLP